MSIKSSLEIELIVLSKVPSVESSENQAFASATQACKIFKSCARDDIKFKDARNDYFRAIDQMYKVYFSKSKPNLYCDSYISAAEAVLEKSIFKQYPESLMRLTVLADAYVKAFDVFNKTLTQSDLNTLGDAHELFARRFVSEFKSIKDLSCCRHLLK